jgi:two-component system, NtrC family, response regulator AtoC
MLDAATGHLSLLIVTETRTWTVALPGRGEVVLGRGSEAGVRVDDPQLSRRHVMIVLGATTTLRDLGSTNGTSVGGRRLRANEEVPLSLGDTIAVGGSVITLQSTATSVRQRRVWAHGYFEARLEEECARSDRSDASFSVVRVRVLGEGGSTEALANVLNACLRPSDIVAEYAPNELEVLLVATTPDEAEIVARRVEDRFNQEGRPVQIGIAIWKRDGRTPEALISHAATLERESSRPGDAFATEPLRLGAMRRLEPLIERVASGVINVLIIGETGVGKEVVARTIHEKSPRANARLVAINCAALSETLLESELFGYERGAFTGAVQAKVGLLEAAEGGTVFLDEAGEMPLALQAKLLRVLDQREVFRVGSVVPRPIDVRFIAATNRDLAGEIARGRFRQDLFFRLNGITLAVPPLRERVEEVVPLARMFVAKAARHAGRGSDLRISHEALSLLRGYSWPGNVRELRNVMERAVLLCAGDEIRAEHLPGEKMVPLLAARQSTSPPTVASDEEEDLESEVPTQSRVSLSKLTPGAISERDRIRLALDECGGNQTHAARLLGISRGTLIARIQQHDIPRPRKR